jgi:hypothetical protein
MEVEYVYSRHGQKSEQFAQLLSSLLPHWEQQDEDSDGQNNTPHLVDLFPGKVSNKKNHSWFWIVVLEAAGTHLQAAPDAPRPACTCLASLHPGGRPSKVRGNDGRWFRHHRLAALSTQ